MRIFIDDGLQMKYKTGIGNYTKNLICYLKKRDIDVEVSQHEKISRNNKVSKIKYLYEINFNKTYKNIYEGFDFAHFTDYVIPYIRNKKCKYVVTIHDLVCFKFPKTLPFLYRIYIIANIKYSVKNADIVLTVSESIKKEIIEMFPDYADKVYVVPCGVSNGFKRLNNKELYELSKKYKEPENFFLFVGVLEQRKNVEFLIRAFDYAKEKYQILNDFKYKLILVGKKGKGFTKIQNQINNSKFKDDIIVKGFIDFDELLLLYNQTKGFLYPSTYEGFGLPVLEAVSCGSKVLASRIPTNMEIASDYAIFYKNNDCDSFANELINLINSPEKKEIADKIINKYDYNSIIEYYIKVLKKYEI